MMMGRTDQELRELLDSISAERATMKPGEYPEEQPMPATALPDGMEVVGWRHTLHMDGGETAVRLARAEVDRPWGKPGIDFDRSFTVTIEPLVRISQAQSALAAMRVERDEAVGWPKRSDITHYCTDCEMVAVLHEGRCGCGSGRVVSIASMLRRADTLEAQVQRLTEDNEALRHDAGELVVAQYATSAAESRAEAAEQQVRDMREGLEPFATVGRIIDGPFGPALFAEDEMAFKSGCAWTENGETRTLTWGHFRRAARLLLKEGGE